MQKAFVLGAGLGTRLKSLTDQLPKPLIPVHQKPLITSAFDHLISAGFNSFIVNTHHRADRYNDFFPGSRYRDCPVEFRFEPILLETGGGIVNIADLVASEPFLVYNGDILTDLPLEPLLERHRASGNEVTLALRSHGPSLHIAWNPDSGAVTDISGLIGTDHPCKHQFTGIYAVEPAFIARLTPGKKESVIPHFLNLIREGGKLGGVVLDEGEWWDLGDREAYLDASASLSEDGGRFPRHGRRPDQVRIHPTAEIQPGAEVCPRSTVGAGAVIESGAVVEDSILWPEARVAADARLRRCIVRQDALASGVCSDADL